MKRRLRKGLTLLLAMVCVVSGALAVCRLWDYRAADKTYHAARELVLPAVPDSAVETAAEPPLTVTEEPIPLTQIPGEEPAALELLPEPTVEPIPAPAQEPLEENAQFLLELDVDALRQTNGDVLGWIYIPDSVINYPLMAFGNNETGLHQSWDGSRSSAGSIFLEGKNRRDFSDFNTLIYGHRMRNGSMFGSLKQYQKQDYLDSHALIYIVTDETLRRYQVFAAYEAKVLSDTYRLYFESDEQKEEVLQYYRDSSLVESEWIPTAADHVLTLSTCLESGNYNHRWVVQAVQTGEFPRGE